MSPEPSEGAVVCGKHLRFLPCRRCGGRTPFTSDPFIVEIARRYQAGQLQFRLDVDALAPADPRGVLTREETDAYYAEHPEEITPEALEKSRARIREIIRMKGVPSNAELAERAKDLDAYTVVRGWLQNHPSPRALDIRGGADREEWLDWAAGNFLGDPEVAQHLAPRADAEAQTVEAICKFLRREAMTVKEWLVATALAQIVARIEEGAWRQTAPAQSNPDLWKE